MTEDGPNTASLAARKAAEASSAADPQELARFLRPQEPRKPTLLAAPDLIARPRVGHRVVRREPR